MSDPAPTNPDPRHSPPGNDPPPPRPVAGHARRPRRVPVVVVAAAATLVLAGAGAGAATVMPGIPELTGDGSGPVGRWQPGLSEAPTTAGTDPSPDAPAADTVTFSATGDIIMGNVGALPAADGAGFFDGVADALAADLVMGNLEQPLTDDTGHQKCPEDSDACFAFRAPPHYAAHLREGGFHLMNLANNHGNDFGAQGRENTRAALEDQGLAHTGERDQITVTDVADRTVAVVGFSPYAWTNHVNDLAQAEGVVTEAATLADLVVVQVHMGAEGADATRVPTGPETYFGEPRGDPRAFARTVVDAGADLVVGHGPHVLRGLEVYQGRLVAYSLGNFAGGGGTLNADGNLGLGAVLRASLRPDGSFADGRLVSTHMYDAGIPSTDPEQRSLDLVRDLTGQDFPETGPRLGPEGEITPPT